MEIDKNALLKSVLEMMPDPADVLRSQREYEESLKVWSKDWPRYVREFPDQWIAIYKGELRARADTLKTLLQEMDRLGVPRGASFVTHVLENEPVIVLGCEIR